MKFIIQHKLRAFLQFVNINENVLLKLGYKKHILGHFCPPSPAHSGLYQLEFEATVFIGNKPVKGTEEWRAYLTCRDLPTIRRFKTVEELNFFHKGMCGQYLI